MPYKTEVLRTNTGIESEKYTLRLGNNVIAVHTQGGIFEIYHNDQPVTAQWPIDTQLVNLDRVHLHRGGSPFLDPAGRYSNKLSQPGLVDIHGVFVGLPWEVTNIDENAGVIETALPASRWKEALKNYYYQAALIDDPDSEQRQSLERLLAATEGRYLRTPYNTLVSKEVAEIRAIIAMAHQVLRQQQLATSIVSLVEMAYPGDADIYRRLSVETWQGENVTSFLDEVVIENTGEMSYLAAPGWHTYFHALLSEVVVPHLWSGTNAPSEYDDNLYDGVKVREIDQIRSLNRRVFVVPLENIGNQIIYRANKTGLKTKRDTAVENWRTTGDGTFPDKHWAIEPGASARMSFRIIVVDGEGIPSELQGFLEA